MTITAWIWLLTLCSAGVWLVILIRMRFLEKTFPPLDADTVLPEPEGRWPLISVIVPARNEEKEVGACLASLVHQDYPRYELIFVDDESTDKTLTIAQATVACFPFVKVIVGKPRPSDRWMGKSWALVQGVAGARGDWLLFIDSDVVHHPATLRQAMTLALKNHIDALSLMPSIECRSFWEKMIMPLFALLTALIEPLDRANHPEKSGSRLSGAFILIRREAYKAVGGHQVISDQILEDMALARLLKAHGKSTWLTYTHDLTRTRMYDSFSDLWMGLTRLSFPMMNYSLVLLLTAYLAAFIGSLVPWLALSYGILQCWRESYSGLALALVGLVLCAASPCILKKVFRVLKISSRYAWFLPLATTVYCLAGTYSAFRYFAGQGLDWKQRVYQRGKK